MYKISILIDSFAISKFIVVLLICASVQTVSLEFEKVTKITLMWLKYFLRKRLGSECHSFLWKYVHYVSTSILAYYFIINCCLQVLQIYVTPVGPHLSLLRLALTGDIFFMHFLKLSFKHSGMKFSFMSLCDFHDSWGKLAPLQ